MIRVKCLRTAGIAAAIAALASRGATLVAQEPPLPLQLPVCYALGYSGDSAADSIFYASRVALAMGDVMGRVASRGFDDDPLGIWERFRRSGMWLPRLPDSLLLLFAAVGVNSEMGRDVRTARVVYEFAIRGDSLVGRVRLFERRPWLQVVGRRVPCQPRELRPE
jgi:hypothetical protein